MVVALVELAPGAGSIDGQIAEHCRSRLAGYKRPKQIVTLDAIEHTVAGKPDYRKLRAIAAALVRS
jgi:acyl-CoA synthetase (AMP-forming)/AMP-acid ligase II